MRNQYVTVDILQKQINKKLFIVQIKFGFKCSLKCTLPTFY